MIKLSFCRTQKGIFGCYSTHSEVLFMIDSGVHHGADNSGAPATTGLCGKYPPCAGRNHD